MGVFNAMSNVKRTVEDPRTDHKLPHPASLSWNLVTEASALVGTKGPHCELVHGDRWHQVRGNVTENIQKNLATTVTGNHSHEVSGNQSLSVIGDTINTHVGTCTKTYVDSKIETYSKHRYFSMSGNTDYTYADTQYQGFGWKLQVCVFQTQINGWTINLVVPPIMAMETAGDLGHRQFEGQPDSSHTPLLVAATSGGAAMSATLNGGLNLSLDVINIGATGIAKFDQRAFKMKLNPLAAELFAAMGKAGGLHAGANARLNCVPGPSSPVICLS